MMRRPLLTLGLAALALCHTAPATAQDVITLQGGTPVGPQTASPVMALRELPDGRLLIATAERGLVLRVDPRTQRVDTILRAGGVEIPPQMAAMGLPTALAGVTLGYFSISSPASGAVLSNPMAPTAPLRFTAAGDTAGSAQNPRVPLRSALVAVDASGASYVIGVGVRDAAALAEGHSPLDPLVPLLRLRPGSDAPDTIAMVTNPGTQAMRQRQERTDTEIRMLMRPADGTPTNTFAVFEDGTVLILSGADYSLRRIAPDGTQQQLATLPTLGRPVTDAMRRASIDSTARVASIMLTFVEQQMKSMMAQMGDMPPEVLAQMPKIAVAIDSVAPFAEQLPPFTGVFATVGDRAWVAVPADLLGSTAHFDVVRADGTLLGRVRPPEGEQVISVSSTAVYTRQQSGTTQQIQRYALPAAVR
jgi:hypothetical protein